MTNRIKKAIIASLVVVSFGASAEREDAGHLEKPNSQRGKVVFVNKQTRLPASEIDVVANLLAKATDCRIEQSKSADGANVVIEIIDDDNAAPLVTYPESHRSVVNIAKLDAGLKGNAVEKFFSSRCRKELLRAFAFACGGGASSYKNNVMTIDSIADLDLVDEFLPYDALACCQDRLKGIGVTPKETVTYRRACREGWAPKPTNDIQRAVWEKVHSIPNKPLKIEYDRATQKGKVTKRESVPRGAKCRVLSAENETPRPN